MRRVATRTELDGVHILYVGARAPSPVRARCAPARDRAADPHRHRRRTRLDGGGVINFIEVNRNVRFEISLNAADRARLKIDSALLSVAARVERRPQGAINAWTVIRACSDRRIAASGWPVSMRARWER